MEKESQIEFGLFRVPQFESTKGKKKKIVAGLIDASGSMVSYWAAMAKFWNQSIAESAEFLITFSHVAKFQENTILFEDLKKHGGGMTNIFAAFQCLEQRLMKVPEQASITIIFISDGQDTTNGEHKLLQKMKTLRGGLGRDITMLCLGIQNGFPTKMAMKIRELYHTGDEKIPAIYLIEYASEKAFFNKFQTMANCFKVSNDVKILNNEKAIKEYPWQKQVNPALRQRQWLMVHHSIGQLKLIFNNTDICQFPVIPLQQLQLEDLVDCFRGWVQKVQLLSMDNSKMSETSKIALLTADIMKEYSKVYEKHHKLYILTEKPLGLKQSFKERAASLAVKNTGSRIKWFIDELLIIAKGVGIGGLGQAEAAKRIGIGTITGKYHQKALALKGITVKDFEVIKQEFTEIFPTITLSEKPSPQQGSIFTLQNQKEVFQEPDFLEGLKLCKSQFDLVQSFPVVGYSLKVKRYDGSMINPWKVRVLQLAKTHRSIDSVYLANNDNIYALSVGEGKVEEINAVLPLFTEQDIEMSKLFNTKLFKLAVSFMVVQNIDTFHQQAYLALLASTFVFLLKEPQSEWRDNLFNLIYSSLKVTYGQTVQFNEFIKKSLSEPHHLFTSKQKENHTDITKVMILVYFIGREKLLSTERFSHFVDLVMVHYVEKTYVQNQFKLSRVAQIEVKFTPQESLTKEEIKVAQMKEFNIIKNFDQLKKIVENEVSSVVNTDQIDIKFSEKIFLHNQQDKRVTYDHIKSFYQKCKKEKLQNKDFIYYFGHALKGKTPQIYNTPVDRDIDEVKKEVFKKIDTKSLGPNQGKQLKTLKKIIEDRYVDTFQRTHFGIVPITQAKLKEVCLERALDFKALHLNINSGMVSNACMSPNCKYYLQALEGNQLSEHMRLWKKSLPNRFHFDVVIQLKQKKSVDEIYKFLINSGHINLKKHHKTEEEVLEYIKKIQAELTA